MLKVFEPDISLAPKWSPVSLSKKNPPEFRLIKGQLPQLNPKAIESAVSALISEIDVKGDPVGFFNQTLKTIASATFLSGTNDFWMAEESGDVMAYATGHICNDIDDKLTMYFPQAWVHPRYRNNRIVKKWMSQMIARAKECLCQHIVIVSARDARSFCKWLGGGFEPYATLLKADL